MYNYTIVKIAIVRGDFAAPSEFYNFEEIAKRNTVCLFTGKVPVWDLSRIKFIKIIRLFSPVDLNFGRISLWKMAILNRIFTDAHVLFGLEDKLKGFDIAHTAETYYSYTQQCIDAKNKGYVKKVISSVWENIAFNNEGIRGRKAFKENAYKKVDMFLALTEKAKDVLIQEGCNPTKVKVLKLGVDLDKFIPTQKNNSNKIRLLFVGRLIKEKGILEVVEIFKKLHKKFPNTELIISGEGDLYENLKSMIKNRILTSVKLIGKINYDEMPRIYNLADVFIHYPIGSKTWKEQYGMVLVESLACGLPIVALDKGSIGEVIGDGGIVASKDNFKKELVKIIKDKKYRDSLSKKARKFAEENYDSREYAQELQNLYNKLLIEK